MHIHLLWTTIIVLICLAFVSNAAAASDADALLQLKALAADASGVQSWQAGTDPCGGVAACALGSCSWAHVACDQHHVIQVDMSGLGLQGSVPAGWQAPVNLQSLDLSNNKQLCGSLPEALIKRGSSTVVQAAGSSIGQPCTRAMSGAAEATGTPVSSGSSTAGSSLSSVAKGLLGAGVGVGVLAGAAAASVFFWRKRKADARGNLVSHDLARIHDSVIVTKKKNRVKASTLNSSIAATGATPGESTVAAGGSGDGAAVAARGRADLRMVAFADGGGCVSAEEDKQRLRAANVQDSVVIIRSRLLSGQLSLSGARRSDDDSKDGSEADEHSQQETEAMHGEHEQVTVQDVTLPPGSAVVKEPAAGSSLWPQDSNGAGLQAEGAVQQRTLQVQHSSIKRVQFTTPAPAAVAMPDGL